MKRCTSQLLEDSGTLQLSEVDSGLRAGLPHQDDPRVEGSLAQRSEDSPSALDQGTLHCQESLQGSMSLRFRQPSAPPD